jgi:hypothetical protein
MMWKEFSCHLIGGRMLFTLGNKYKAFFFSSAEGPAYHGYYRTTPHRLGEQGKDPGV